MLRVILNISYKINYKDDDFLKKVKIGDIFSIETSKGLCLFQYVYLEETVGELTYVFPGLHERLPNLIDLKKDRRGFYVHFPVKTALKRKIINFVESSSFPESHELPSYFKTAVTDREGNVTEWQIVDYKTWQRYSEEELNIEAEQLSPWGIWNDTYLIDYMIDKWGRTN